MRVFQAQGASMAPSIHHGQWVLIEGLSYRFILPRRGDIVVFRSLQDPSRCFIKRIVGVPGDRIVLVNGDVYVNDGLLPEPYVIDKGWVTWGPCVVRCGAYVVLGDNRRRSNDSTYWGLLPRENILGRVVGRIPNRQIVMNE